MSGHRLVVALALAAACDGGGGGTGRDQDEALCEIVGEPGTSIVASATEADAPNLAVDGGPYTVTLVPNSVLFVTFTVVEAGTVLVYVDADDVLTGLKTEGEQLPLVEPQENPYCPDELPAVFELDLAAGTSLLRLGPVDATEVWIHPVTPE